MSVASEPATLVEAGTPDETLEVSSPPVVTAQSVSEEPTQALTVTVPETSTSSPLVSESSQTEGATDKASLPASILGASQTPSELAKDDTDKKKDDGSPTQPKARLQQATKEASNESSSGSAESTSSSGDSSSE